jgi:hypothetical protein
MNFGFRLTAAGRKADGLLLFRTVSLGLEVFSRFFALVGNEFVFDLLTLIEGAEAGAFDRRDMNEHVLAAVAIRLNKPITLGRIEPLHSTGRHHRSSC